MAAFSGKDGKVTYNSTDIVDTLSWTLNDVVGLHPYGSNATSGGTRRVAGRTDWNGTFTFAVQAAAQAVTPGSSVAIVLNLDGTKFFSGTGIVGNVSYSVDVNGAGIVQGVANFEANGALTRPV